MFIMDRRTYRTHTTRREVTIKVFVIQLCPLFQPQVSKGCHQHVVLLLTHYHKCRILMPKRYIAVENIVRKGEIACNKQFLLFSQCFLPYMALIFHVKCTLKCHLQFVSIFNLDQCKILLSGNGRKLSYQTPLI